MLAVSRCIPHLALKKYTVRAASDCKQGSSEFGFHSGDLIIFISSLWLQEKSSAALYCYIYGCLTKAKPKKIPLRYNIVKTQGTNLESSNILKKNVQVGIDSKK